MSKARLILIELELTTIFILSAIALNFFHSISWGEFLIILMLYLGLSNIAYLIEEKGENK